MVISLSSQMTESLTLRPCEIYMDSGLQFHVSKITNTMHSVDNTCKQLWLIDNAEHNLLDFSITELLLMLHSKHGDPQYHIIIVWLPGTDSSGNLLPTLYSKRSRSLKSTANSSSQSCTAHHHKASTLLQCPLLMPGTQEKINKNFVGT